MFSHDGGGIIDDAYVSSSSPGGSTRGRRLPSPIASCDIQRGWLLQQKDTQAEFCFYNLRFH